MKSNNQSSEISAVEHFKAAKKILESKHDERLLSQAMAHFEAAAGMQHAEASLMLAYLIADDFSDANLEKAFPFFKKSFEISKIIKDNPLPLYYGKGLVVDEDINECVRLLKIGHSQLDFRHSNALARLCLINDTPCYDVNYGLSILKDLAKDGQSEACFHYGKALCENGDPALGIEILKSVSDSKDIDLGGDLEFEIGKTYRNGAFVIGNQGDFHSNLSEAKLWLEKAHTKGHSTALTYIPSERIEIVCNKILNKNQRSNVLEHLLDLESKFFEIRDRHIVRDRIWVSHFTGWNTLESLLPIDSNAKAVDGCNLLRQYHVDYMNDPTEGFRLLSYHKNLNCQDKKSIESSRLLNNLFNKNYYQRQENSSAGDVLPSVFICSLTKEGDRLDLWRAYGQDGGGYCISFEFDGAQHDNELASRNRDNLRFFDNSTRKSDAHRKDNTGFRGGAAPILYEIQYSDEAIEKTLNEIHAPLSAALSVARSIPDLEDEIEVIIAETILELLFLYKDEQYSSELEVRAITVSPIGDVGVKMDARSPGRLYVETAPFLFKTNTRIIVGPKVPARDVLPAIWNIRWRIEKHKYDSDISVINSKVQYR